MLVAFPIEDGQMFPWADSGSAPEMQKAAQRCFVDASVCLRAGSVDDAGWPSIGDLSINGDTLSFSVRVDGVSVPITVSGSPTVKFPIVSGAASWGSYVVVLSSEGVSDFCANFPPAGGILRSSSVGSEGSYVRLCAKCVTFASEGIRSLEIYNGVDALEDGPHSVVVGDVSIRPGNNMLLAENDDDPNAVELNAEPGAGLGIVPCVCENETGTEAHRLIGGADGHARIFNDTCYDLEPNTSTGVLQIHTKCTACCTCSMYESIVNRRLVVLANAVRKAKKDIYAMYEAYESAVKKFNARIARPTMADVSLTLTGMPIGAKISPVIGNSRVKGKMERCVFTAILCNSSFFSITAEVGSIIGTSSVVEASAAWSDANGGPLSKTGDGPGGATGRFVIYPGRSLVVTFVSVKDEMVSSVVTGGYTGSISVGVSWEGGFLGNLSKTVSV
jgi:hypothetical protein